MTKTQRDSGEGPKPLKNFWKIEGAGNDFVLIEADPDSFGPVALSEGVPRICHRHRGIGADGMVFTWLAKNGARHWRFFNSDASETDVCGNAARALAYWLSKCVEPNENQWNWRGNRGLFRARPKLGQIEVTWPQESLSFKEIPDILLDQLSAGLNDHGLAGLFWINIGVPHFVLLNHETWNPEQRTALNSVLRAHAALGPEGANITWLGLKTLETVTFERGVEAETLACGSGALAAYVSMKELYKTSSKDMPKNIALKFPGGILTVAEENNEFWLGGPASVVFKGELTT